MSDFHGNAVILPAYQFNQDDRLCFYDINNTQSNVQLADGVYDLPYHPSTLAKCKFIDFEKYKIIRDVYVNDIDIRSIPYELNHKYDFVARKEKYQGPLWDDKAWAETNWELSWSSFLFRDCPDLHFQRHALVISATPGSGKTYMCDKYPHLFIDGDVLSADALAEPDPLIRSNKIRKHYHDTRSESVGNRIILTNVPTRGIPEWSVSLRQFKSNIAKRKDIPSEQLLEWYTSRRKYPSPLRGASEARLVAYAEDIRCKVLGQYEFLRTYRYHTAKNIYSYLSLLDSNDKAVLLSLLTDDPVMTFSRLFSISVYIKVNSLCKKYRFLHEIDQMCGYIVPTDMTVVSQIVYNYSHNYRLEPLTIGGKRYHEIVKDFLNAAEAPKPPTRSLVEYVKSGSWARSTGSTFMKEKSMPLELASERGKKTDILPFYFDEIVERVEKGAERVFDVVLSLKTPGKVRIVQMTDDVNNIRDMYLVHSAGKRYENMPLCALKHRDSLNRDILWKESMDPTKVQLSEDASKMDTQHTQFFKCISLAFASAGIDKALLKHQLATFGCNRYRFQRKPISYKGVEKKTSFSGITLPIEFDGIEGSTGMESGLPTTTCTNEVKNEVATYIGACHCKYDIKAKTVGDDGHEEVAEEDVVSFLKAKAAVVDLGLDVITIAFNRHEFLRKTYTNEEVFGYPARCFQPLASYKPEKDIPITREQRARRYIDAAFSFKSRYPKGDVMKWLVRHTKISNSRLIGDKFGGGILGLAMFDHRGPSLEAIKINICFAESYVNYNAKVSDRTVHDQTILENIRYSSSWQDRLRAKRAKNNLSAYNKSYTVEGSRVYHDADKIILRMANVRYSQYCEHRWSTTFTNRPFLEPTVPVKQREEFEIWAESNKQGKYSYAVTHGWWQYLKDRSRYGRVIADDLSTGSCPFPLLFLPKELQFDIGMILFDVLEQQRKLRVIDIRALYTEFCAYVYNDFYSGLNPLQCVYQP